MNSCGRREIETWHSELCPPPNQPSISYARFIVHFTLGKMQQQKKVCIFFIFSLTQNLASLLKSARNMCALIQEPYHIGPHTKTMILLPIQPIILLRRTRAVGQWKNCKKYAASQIGRKSKFPLKRHISAIQSIQIFMTYLALFTSMFVLMIQNAFEN